MKRRARPEQVVQRALMQHLQLRGVRNLFAFHVPNGGGRSATEGAILKGMGVVAGVPDILIIRDGKVFALELKAEGGRTTPAQTEMQQRMRDAGAIVGVEHGLDNALHRLEAWGLLRGKTT